MVKKLKSLAGAAGESQLAQTVRDSAQQIWLAGLGAFAKAQEGGSKVFDALVKEGEALQGRTRKAAEEKVTEIADKASGTWDRLEQVFEDRVARALNRLGVPTRKDVETLTRRVEELTETIHKMAPEGERKPAARRRTTTTPTK